jgi:hypothetical protein
MWSSAERGSKDGFSMCPLDWERIFLEFCTIFFLFHPPTSQRTERLSIMNFLQLLSTLELVVV